MSIRALCLAGLLALGATPAPAAEASAWSPSTGGAVRLVPGDPVEGGWRAGVEVKLEPGWKTYWRTPGDSGVPPQFDWSRSDNVAAVDVAYPAPVPIPDGSGVSIGYDDDVVFPLTVRAKDPGKPAHLVLAMDYAVCEAVCVPAKGEADLRLQPGERAPAGLSTLIAAHEARVPLAQPAGASEGLAVADIRFRADATPPMLVVEVRASGQPSLFVEGPPDWFLPLPQETAMPSLHGGTRVFAVPLRGLPKDARLAGTRLTLTLAAPEGAVETTYTLP